MAFARWYPTTVTLSDGRLLVASGSTTCSSCIADIPEIYNPATNTWTQLPGARLELPLYPFLFVLPDGRVLNPGSDEDPMITRVLDLQTQTWTTMDPTLLEGGSAVMFLPGQVMKSGTASDVDRPSAPTIANTYVLDTTQSSPRWRQSAPMAFPRGHHNLTILPDGTVLVTGGGRTTDGVNLHLAVLRSRTMVSGDGELDDDGQHAEASVVPFDSSAAAGRPGFVRRWGKVCRIPDINQLNAEIYSPPYLFKGSRPVITAAPATIENGTAFFVGTDNPAAIARVTLVAPGAVTHSVNMQQRFLSLAFEQTSGGLNVQLPANPNLALPGDYMLFLIGSNGVPSIASFVSVPLQESPLPVMTSMNPTSATSGGAGFTLTVNGSNFVASSSVRWNGSGRPTTFVSSTQLRAAISAADIAAAGTAQVTVFNPAPGGGTSNQLAFTINNPNNPLPTTTGLNPSSAVAGGAGFTLTVNGSNFVATSVVRWNGANRTTTFVSATQLTAAIPATDIATAGTAQVTVFNPAPGGGTSNPQTFTVTASSNPVPTTTSLNPSSAPAGGAAFTLTVNGTNFVASSMVRWNGANRTTTFVSATQLTAAIPATDIATAGTAQVTVFNPAPGGGTSNPQTFTITAGGSNPVPATTGLNPASAPAGGTAFTLTVNGSNFVAASVVRWNGTDRPTTFVSATQLTAAIAAADIAAAGTATVTCSPPPQAGAPLMRKPLLLRVPPVGWWQRTALTKATDPRSLMPRAMVMAGRLPVRPGRPPAGLAPPWSLTGQAPWSQSTMPTHWI